MISYPHIPAYILHNPLLFVCVFSLSIELYFNHLYRYKIKVKGGDQNSRLSISPVIASTEYTVYGFKLKEHKKTSSCLLDMKLLEE